MDDVDEYIEQFIVQLAYCSATAGASCAKYAYNELERYLWGGTYIASFRIVLPLECRIANRWGYIDKLPGGKLDMLQMQLTVQGQDT